MEKWEKDLNSIIRKISMTDTIEKNMTLREELGIDSLRLVELIVNAEELFDTELEMSDLDPSVLNTVGDLYSLLSHYVSKRDSRGKSLDLYKYITAHMEKFPQKTLSFGEQHLSYHSLLAFSKNFSKKLSQPKYGILCTSELNCAKAVLSCIAGGVTAVPLSYQYGQTHIDRVIESTRLSFLITDESGELEIKQIAPPQPETEDLSKVAFILCTSGTTGVPKGAMLTQGNVIANLAGIGDYFEINESDRILIVRPLYHCAVMMGEFLISLCRGLDIIFQNGPFNPAYVLDLVVKARITVMCATPTLFYYLCFAAKRARLKMKLRVIAVSGECMTEIVAQTLLEILPDTRIYNVYGLTEAGPRVSYLPPELFKESPRSSGYPIINTTVKVDDGELFVKGPGVMKGYYAEQAKTEEVLCDGWLRTGDLAEIDQDGRITIKGRKDDLIIRGGMNIYPCEIENALKADGRIIDVMAYGKESGVTQKICLQVVAKGLTVSEIMEVCRQTLPGYQIPSEIEIVDELPKNGSGKVRRLK